MAMAEYLTMLEVASISNDHTLFYQHCKERGLNMDLMHRWMATNGIANSTAARSLMVELVKPVKSMQTASNQAKMKLVA
jgi:hypothetical protein